MRVEVLEILDPAQRIVRFRCESGTASGRWMGSALVEAGRYDVELEVPEEVVEWTAEASGTASLAEAAGTERAALITGQVVGYDDGDDPVVEIRVGPDILLVEIPERRQELLREGFISFRAPEIQLYPYDL
ncbi:hypothetical protein [Streptomyces neyagawaensis]|uniref:hypothetical protein n=1 Tax=Streptomyces neyagawaensis TaxID=42238 RepID=UPI0006E3D32D|nr:hypothetical protein [Streptomyces neyagawaensis]MCL6736484.1 hypothetical protein [Streptomyces neyagawaensis]MDE1680878.1 hypothetical protein [Streptomyces neyagawaensis]